MNVFIFTATNRFYRLQKSNLPALLLIKKSIQCAHTADVGWLVTGR